MSSIAKWAAVKEFQEANCLYFVVFCCVVVLVNFNSILPGFRLLLAYIIVHIPPNQVGEYLEIWAHMIHAKIRNA